MSNLNLLTETLRPTKVKQLILPPRIERIIGDGDLKMNLLFYGNAGIGKTSAAKVIASKYPNIYINCSDENGVDIVRDKIKTFCSTISVLDGEESIKVVVLDEFDFATPNMFAALRAVIEQFAHTSRFIATCNYIEKIPEAIQSRLEPVNFNLLTNEEEEIILSKQIERTTNILAKIGISSSALMTEKLVKRSFPDLRKLYNRIQTLQISKITEVTEEAVISSDYQLKEVFELIVNGNDPYKNYTTLVGDYSSKVDAVLYALGSEFPNWLSEFHPKFLKSIPQVIVEIANHQAQKNMVIDPVITMLSCIFKIQIILSNQK